MHFICPWICLSLKVIKTTFKVCFSKYCKIIFFRAKIASARKGPFSTAPIIKNGPNWITRLFTKLLFEEFFILRWFRSILCENKSPTFFFVDSFFTLKIIFQFDTYFGFAAMIVNVPFLISAQRKLNVKCTFSKMAPNNAQKANSIIYGTYVYSPWLTPELSTLKLFHAWWYYKTAFSRERSLHPSEKILPPIADSSLKRAIAFYHSVIRKKKKKGNHYKSG